MKKGLLGLLILALLVVGYVIFMMTEAPSEKTTEALQISKQEVKKELSSERQNHREVEKQKQPTMPATHKVNTIAEEKAGKNEADGGIDLELDGKQLKEIYQAETVEYYGWKSYWENELYVILMESSRAYPFIEQQTDCRAKTCKVEVSLSMEQVMYMKQAVSTINDEFARRKIPLAIERIDLEHGVVGFYVQPGEIGD